MEEGLELDCAVATLEELVGFLNGNQFGQELWKYLAMGAFLFLLIEIALSRWIAHSRRMGEEILLIGCCCVV